ncbi:unnamed protein product [Microthlaspi erraticum]|uniref:Uncharacterized protein n=1 Tax=Microthlaspi erraticum TaxID=1685480 RepID=A0A6D2IUK6_9BRAS|nr:unnamed protein product [Microthlaspi erraticum]
MQEQQYQLHHIPLMQVKNMWRVPRGEDDWALVTFVGEQNQDPRKCKKAMEKVNIEPCVKMDTQTLDLLKIRDDVTWYIRKLGLSKLFKLECSEYSQLTKEFLSTVALAFPNHNGDQPAGRTPTLQDRRCQWAHLHLSSMPTLWTSQ